MTRRTKTLKEYIAVEEDLTIIEQDYPLTANRIRSRPAPDSAKKHQSFQENMKRLHGEIERMVYAAEISCNQRNGCDHQKETICPFNNPDEPACNLQAIREAIGDHFEQHDCMREHP
jgi:hypothetical protein